MVATFLAMPTHNIEPHGTHVRAGLVVDEDYNSVGEMCDHDQLTMNDGHIDCQRCGRTWAAFTAPSKEKR